MLCNMELKVAVKDSDCRYNCMDTSIFHIENTNKYLPNFQWKITKAKEVSIIIKCPICGEKHETKYGLKEFLKRQVIIGGCEVTGVPIYFIGKPHRVNKYLIKYNEVNKKIYAMI